MNEYLPVIAGFGVVIVIIVAARLLPHSWLQADLLRHYGAKPSGAYAVMMRRDLVRRGAYSAAAAAVLLGLAFGLFPLSERFPNGSRLQIAFEAYFFGSFILAAVAAFASLLAFLAIPFWRPRRIRMTPERREDFSNYLMALTRAEVPAGKGADFTAIRFNDPVAEEIRAKVVARVGARPDVVSPIDAQWLGEAATRLLESAI